MFFKFAQKGFATLEVILMITVLGIISAVAIPRFVGVTTTANTTKVQSDLSTIDTAIALYYMDKGQYPNGLSDLGDYIQDVDTLKPPTGKIYVDGDETDMPDTKYSIISISNADSTTNSEKRAAIGNYTAGHITKTKPTSTTTT